MDAADMMNDSGKDVKIKSLRKLKRKRIRSEEEDKENECKVMMELGKRNRPIKNCDDSEMLSTEHFNRLVDCVVQKGIAGRALLTIPQGFLEIKPSGIHGLGVWALKRIPKNCLMGPYEGTVVDLINGSGYCWLLENGTGIDAEDPRFSNWMRYVNCPRILAEQNLEAFEQDGQILYKSIRDIEANEELLVHYGDEYAKALGIDVNSFNGSTCEQSETLGHQCEDSWRRFYARFKCKWCEMDVDLQDLFHVHQTQHANEAMSNSSDIDNRPALWEVYDSNEMECNAEEIPPASSCELDVDKKSLKKSNDSRYVCQICNKSYKKNVSLSLHMYKHTGQPAPYNCSLCEYASTSSWSVKRHIKYKHTKEKPFKCQYCNKTYVELRVFEKHIAVRHSL